MKVEAVCLPFFSLLRTLVFLMAMLANLVTIIEKKRFSGSVSFLLFEVNNFEFFWTEGSAPEKLVDCSYLLSSSSDASSL